MTSDERQRPFSGPFALLVGLALVLLAVPTSTADVQSVGLVQARAAEIQGADPTVEGDLRGIKLLSWPDHPTSPTPALSAHLALEASYLRVEIDEDEFDHPPLVRTEPFETKVYEYRNGTLEGSRADDVFRLFIASLEGEPAPATILTGPGTLAPSSLHTLQEAERHPDREPREVDVSESFTWRSSTESTRLTVQGDFYIGDWDVPFRAEGEGDDPVDFDGSEEEKPIEAGPPTSGTYRTAHLFARDATLTLTIEGKIQSDGIYLDPGTVNASEGVHFKGLTGTYRFAGDNTTVRNASVDFEAPMELKAFRFVDSSTFRFAFSALRPQQEDQPIPDPAMEPAEPAGPAVVATQPKTVDWALPLVGVLFMMTGATGTLLVRRPPFWLLASAMRGHRYAYVNRHASRFFEGKRAHAAATLHSVALLARGREDEASDFLSGLSRADRPEQPTWDYLMATSRAMQGDHTGALVHLRDCLEGAPQYLDEVLGNPVFASVLDMIAPQEVGSTSDIGFT